MIERCRSLGVPLRPHMKTLKSVEASSPNAMKPGRLGNDRRGW
jgi:D-serine deaminase-like pyridoxal phosphate-dependent protein